MTFASEIEQAAGGAQNIESIVIGAFGWNIEDDPDADSFRYPEGQTPVPQEMKHTPQKWESVREYLDYTYDGGFGAAEVHAVYVYTRDSVIIVGTYDGSTWLEKIPRNPVDIWPEMVGGG